VVRTGLLLVEIMDVEAAGTQRKGRGFRVEAREGEENTRGGIFGTYRLEEYITSVTCRFRNDKTT